MNYRITELFATLDYLKQSNVAYRCKMNISLFRQYTSGVKEPSESRLKDIESALHKIGKELSNIKITK